MGFSLTKWYFDIVSERGDAAIAYWADVRYGRLRHAFSGLLLHRDGEDTGRWTFSARAAPAPEMAEDGLRWSSAALDVSVRYGLGAPGFSRTLLDGADGSIGWHCEVPASECRFHVGSECLLGSGYAERLEMTVLPWKLPADEIRWGRFVATDASVVWIEWRGALSQRHVFLNGAPASDGEIRDDRVPLRDGGGLALRPVRTLHDQSLGAFLAPLRPLRRLVEPVTRTRQVRWLSRGELFVQQGPPRRGWAIHERLTRG
jgi:hypothetical protein